MPTLPLKVEVEANREGGLHPHLPSTSLLESRWPLTIFCSLLSVGEGAGVTAQQGEKARTGSECIALQNKTATLLHPCKHLDSWVCRLPACLLGGASCPPATESQHDFC